MSSAIPLITTGAGIITGQQGQQTAAGQIARATDANIEFLEEAGVGGAEDIRTAAGRGLEALTAGPSAAEPIQRFADVGTEGFRTAREATLLDARGTPLTRVIASGGLRAAENLGLPSGPVRREVIRRARLGAESTQPEFTRALLDLGRGAGLGGVTDISGIDLRRAQTAGDIERTAGAGIASSLIGQAPNIARQIETGQEARALGIAGQRQTIRTGAEQISELLGRGT